MVPSKNAPAVCSSTRAIAGNAFSKRDDGGWVAFEQLGDLLAHSIGPVRVQGGGGGLKRFGPERILLPDDARTCSVQR